MSTQFQLRTFFHLRNIYGQLRSAGLAAALAILSSSASFAQWEEPDILFGSPYQSSEDANAAASALGAPPAEVPAAYSLSADYPAYEFMADGGPAAAPAATPPDGAAKPPAWKCVTCCNGYLIDWSKYPATIHPLPRPGNFPIPPATGPGYYSLSDQVHGECRQAAPKSGYASFAVNQWAFQDADWRYVDSLNPCERALVEELKRIHPNDCWLFSTGGEYWTRYHHEHNSRLTTTENTYDLDHVRLYGDAWYSDSVRVFGEYVWADSFGEELPPGPLDVDLGDLQQLFIDLKLADCDGHPLFIRGGRQELLYGTQRLISPLSWANKRNTFQGVKVFRQGEKWDFDAFWAQFVPPDPDEFDTPDKNQNLAEAWLTYRPKKGEAIDYYYLFFDNDNSVTQQGIVRAPAQFSTIGSHWSGSDDCGRLWDFEGALQFGDQDERDLFAGMATAGVGHSWKSAAWSPTVWLYYDFASGDSDPNDGDVHTFNQMYAFGHYYLGWMDLVGRQNIHDVNAHLYLYPTPWITFWTQYHHFWLVEPQDALYNAGGVAYRRDPTGQSGTNVGDEIDFIVNFHVARYSDILVSYNKLYGGGFLENTAGPGLASDAETLYLMFTQRW